MFQRVREYFTGKFFCPTSEFVPSVGAEPFPSESVRFPSHNGHALAGFFFKGNRPSPGTLVHCHGNAGRVEDHLPLVQFLVEAGYNVLAFDYGGYGDSKGHPTPSSIIEDALAALDYCRQRPDVDKNKIALFGQSLGGAAASGAMARDPGVRCLVLEATFTTYLAMAKKTSLGKLLFPITPFVIPNKGPLHDLEKIGRRPVLIVHGEMDELVPVHFAHALSKKFPSNTTLLIFKNLRHLEGEELEPNYRREIIGFLAQHLSTNPPSVPAQH